MPASQVCKNPEKVKQRKLELSNEDAVISGLPGLRNQPDSESRDHDHEAGVAHGPYTAAELPRLRRPSVVRAEGHGLRRVVSDSVLRERYDSTSPAGGRDFPLWPRKRKSSTTDPFGRKEYDGPILRNGPIDSHSDPVPMAYPLHRRSETMDEDATYLADQSSIVSMPQAKKRKGVMRNESSALVALSGRRVSSRATFKTPFRTGFDPLAPPPREQPPQQPGTAEATHDNDDGDNNVGETRTASAPEMSDSDCEGQSRVCEEINFFVSLKGCDCRYRIPGRVCTPTGS